VVHVLSVEVLGDSGGVGFNLDYDGLNLIPGMLAIASVVDGSERLGLLDYVSIVLDSFVERIKSPLYVKALDAIGYPLVNVFELVEALGVEGLEEVLEYAKNAIEGEAGEPPEAVEVYADMLGWSSNPKDLERRTLGYAIILSLVASFNKTLNDITTQATAQI
jgi:hypothetical protein